jgi:hypothetical protein
MTDQEVLLQGLFETKALRIAPADKPFWYTSGTFGPYYINTHYLFGSQSEAEDLLNAIDQKANCPVLLIEDIWPRILHQYENNAMYQKVMNILVHTIGFEPFDFISGGQRRDFFFSICAAFLVEKPHVALFKDGSAVFTHTERHEHYVLKKNELNGMNAFHISDLVTEASSYIRLWIPILKELGAEMPKTVSVIDRNQNGWQVLHDAGTELTSLLTIDPSLFERALSAGLIDDRQYAQVIRFIKDPNRYMTDFVQEYPRFLKDECEQGGENGKRARQFLERQDEQEK